MAESAPTDAKFQIGDCIEYRRFNETTLKAELIEMTIKRIEKVSNQIAYLSHEHNLCFEKDVLFKIIRVRV